MPRSRGMRSTILLALTAGCAMGAPPGFSPGQQWTMPLVDPLSDGRLLVPVMVHGHGPYLFVLDRDQGETVVDPEVVNAVGLRAESTSRIIDYNDRGHAAFEFQLTDVEIGTLTLSLMYATVQVKPHAFDADGR